MLHALLVGTTRVQVEPLLSFFQTALMPRLLARGCCFGGAIAFLQLAQVFLMGRGDLMAPRRVLGAAALTRVQPTGSTAIVCAWGGSVASGNMASASSGDVRHLARVCVRKRKQRVRGYAPGHGTGCTSQGRPSHFNNVCITFVMQPTAISTRWQWGTIVRFDTDATAEPSMASFKRSMG